MLGARSARRRVVRRGHRVAALALSACGGGSGFDEDEEAGAVAATARSPSSSARPATPRPRRSRRPSRPGRKKRASRPRSRSLRPQPGARAGVLRGQPPDVFYLSTDNFASYAETGPSSRTPPTWPPPTRSSRRCARRSPTRTSSARPKDFSTLALVINNRLWKQAGLTEDDVPTTWDELGPSPRS